LPSKKKKKKKKNHPKFFAKKLGGWGGEDFLFKKGKLGAEIPSEGERGVKPRRTGIPSIFLDNSRRPSAALTRARRSLA